MRWHGYRSENRYLVFQCLEQTVGIETAKWRVLDQCHKRRNIAEYEGHLEIDSQLLNELIEITIELLELVKDLGDFSNVSSVYHNNCKLLIFTSNYWHINDVEIP